MHAEREKRKEKPQQKADPGARKEAEREATRRERGRKADHGAHQHDALDAEIEYARLFMNHNARGGQKKRRSGIERGGDDRSGE